MEAAPQTRRQMGVWAATAVVTGEAISLGIFLTPAGMARSLGSPALLAAVWCGMALLTLAGALCFTELRHPQSPRRRRIPLSPPRLWPARPLFFTAGWLPSLCILAWPPRCLSAPFLIFRRFVPVPAPVAKALPALILITLGALNYFGTGFSSGVMTALNWLKVPVLAALVGWAFLSGHATMANVVPFAARRPGSDPLNRCHRWSYYQRILLLRGLVGGRERSPARSAIHRATLQLPFPAAC